MSPIVKPRRHSAIRRILLIARRDFMGYVRTLGFWLTMMGPLIGIIFGALGVSVSMIGEPVRYMTIIDETGRYESEIVRAITDDINDDNAASLKRFAILGTTPEQRDRLDKIIEQDGVDAGQTYLAEISPEMAKQYTPAEPKIRLIPPPAGNIEALSPYLSGNRMIDTPDGPQTLSGALFISEADGVVSSQYWSTLTNSSGLIPYANSVLKKAAEEKFLARGNLSREEYLKVSSGYGGTQQLDPTKPTKPAAEGETESSQAVSIVDRIPYLVAAAAAVFLWLTIFSGSYMLLMSMIEEKVNKALEMMLASTRFVEILFGKLLGVAVLTLVSMLPWLLLGGVGLAFVLATGQAGIFNAIIGTFTPALIATLVLFMILGYLFYGALFMAMGSLAESMQDSQTLVTPVILVLTMCLMVVPIGLNAPDSPIVIAASYIPISAPFAMIVRLPGDVALWEIALSAAILAVSTLVVTWGAAKVFQYGILSGGGMGAIKNVLRIGRKKA